jgi:hypothetical protein
VPIKHTIGLQGGLDETETGVESIAAENGETPSKTAQAVPAGWSAS